MEESHNCSCSSSRTCIHLRKRKNNLQKHLPTHHPTVNISSSDTDDEVPNVKTIVLHSNTPKRQRNLICSTYVFRGFDSPQQSERSQLNTETLKPVNESKMSNFTSKADIDISHRSNHLIKEHAERNKSLHAHAKDNVNGRENEQEKTFSEDPNPINGDSDIQHSSDFNELCEFVDKNLNKKFNKNVCQEIAKCMLEQYMLNKQSNDHSRKKLNPSSPKTAHDKPVLKSQSHKCNENLTLSKRHATILHVKDRRSSSTANKNKSQIDSDVSSSSDAQYTNKREKVKSVDIPSLSAAVTFSGKTSVPSTQHFIKSRERSSRKDVQLSSGIKRNGQRVKSNIRHDNTDSNSECDYKMSCNTKEKLVVSTKKYNNKHANFVHLQEKEGKHVTPRKNSSSADTSDDESCNIDTPDANVVPLEDANNKNSERKYKKYQTSKPSHIKNISFCEENNINALPSTSSKQEHNRKIYYSADVRKMFMVSKTERQSSTVVSTENYVAERTKNKASRILGKENRRKARISSSSDKGSDSSPEKAKRCSSDSSPETIRGPDSSPQAVISDSSPENVRPSGSPSRKAMSANVNVRTSIPKSASSVARKKVKRKPQLYNDAERHAIIDFIVKHKAYAICKGNILWCQMEKKLNKKRLCSDRTWQSLKEHFRRKILPDIERYHLPEDVLNEFLKLRNNDPSLDKAMCTGILSSSDSDSESVSRVNKKSGNKASKKKVDSSVSSNAVAVTTTKECNLIMFGKRGWRKNCAFYTAEEDKTIIRYVLRHMNVQKIKGIRLWKDMEESRVLFGRTFHSLKERFFKYIINQLEDYGVPDSVAKSLHKACRKSPLKKNKGKRRKTSSPIFPIDELDSSDEVDYSPDFTPIKKTSNSRGLTNYVESDDSNKISPEVDKNIVSSSSDNYLQLIDTETSASVVKKVTKRKLYTVRHSISKVNQRKQSLRNFIPKEAKLKIVKKAGSEAPSRNKGTETNTKHSENLRVKSATCKNLLEANLEPSSSRQILSSDHKHTEDNEENNYENGVSGANVQKERKNNVKEISIYDFVEDPPENVPDENVDANDSLSSSNNCEEVTVIEKKHDTQENNKEPKNNVCGDIEEFETEAGTLIYEMEFNNEIDCNTDESSARKSTEYCEKDGETLESASKGGVLDSNNKECSKTYNEIDCNSDKSSARKSTEYCEKDGETLESASDGAIQDSNNKECSKTCKGVKTKNKKNIKNTKKSEVLPERKEKPKNCKNILANRGDIKETVDNIVVAEVIIHETISDVNINSEDSEVVINSDCKLGLMCEQSDNSNLNMNSPSHFEINSSAETEILQRESNDPGGEISGVHQEESVNVPNKNKILEQDSSSVTEESESTHSIPAHKEININEKVSSQDTNSSVSVYYDAVGSDLSVYRHTDDTDERDSIIYHALSDG